MPSPSGSGTTVVSWSVAECRAVQVRSRFGPDGERLGLLGGPRRRRSRPPRRPSVLLRRRRLRLKRRVAVSVLAGESADVDNGVSQFTIASSGWSDRVHALRRCRDRPGTRRHPAGGIDGPVGDSLGRPRFTEDRQLVVRPWRSWAWSSSRPDRCPRRRVGDLAAVDKRFTDGVSRATGVLLCALVVGVSCDPRRASIARPLRSANTVSSTFGDTVPSRSVGSSR